MRNGTGEAVETPHDYDIEAALMSIGHEAVELRALVFAATDSNVEVGIDQTPAARLGELLKIARLHGNILAVIRRADSRIDRRAWRCRICASHRCTPLC